jgi:homoserine O-acetyltransferase
MNGVKRIKEFFTLWFALLFVWSGLASAGVSSPVPDPGIGPHTPEHQIANLGDFKFESGEVVKDFKVSYVTHGTLNEKKDNVILVLQAFIQDHHGQDLFIGTGKALDPDKYFIVATDFLGNSHLRQDLTTGPTNSGLKMAFPEYTIRDSVNVEYRFLTEYLGFDRILAAIGASIGAMKAYQFAVSYPTFVSGIIPIVGSPVTNPQIRTMLKNWMDIIELDDGWYSGKYETNPTIGVTIALMNFVPWLYTYQWFAANLKTPEQYRQFEKFWHDIFTAFAPQDARDVYYQLQAWADFNIGNTPGFNGDAQAALQSIKAQVLLIGAKDDMLVRRDEVIFSKNTIPQATHVEIDSPLGHLICCDFDPEVTKIMDREIAKFLDGLQ